MRALNGRIVEGEQIDQLVHPGRPIPPGSTQVHGISDDMVADAPRIDMAGAARHEFSHDAVLVAHNPPFDMVFLHRMDHDWPHPVLDTVLLSAVLFGTTEQHSLDALCDRFGVVIPPEERHMALGDARATAEVLCHMLPILAARGFKTLEQVQSESRTHRRLHA